MHTPFLPGRGQAPGFHTDDPVQNVLIPKGKKLPDDFILPVLAMTAMIWLDDVKEDMGPTQVIPGSHRWGYYPDQKDLYDAKKVNCVGRKGTVVFINSQVWHRGQKNEGKESRHTLQMSFGRRIIGHKHKSIMNYKMPYGIYKDFDDKKKRKMGFLQGGAYS